MKSLKRPSRKGNQNNLELLEKLEKIEAFHQSQQQPSKKRKQATADTQEQYKNQYFVELEKLFSGFHFIFENNIQTSRTHTFSNYFEIFKIYAENILTPFQKSCLDKNLKIEIKSEYKDQKLFFSMLVNDIRFTNEGKAKINMNRTEKATNHLLTPFRGKTQYFIKKNPNRQVKAILVKMELSPLRQHIPSQYFIQQ